MVECAYPGVAEISWVCSKRASGKRERTKEEGEVRRRRYVGGAPGCTGKVFLRRASKTGI